MISTSSIRALPSTSPRLRHLLAVMPIALHRAAARHLRKLVGLYVRAHADAVPVGVGLKRKTLRRAISRSTSTAGVSIGSVMRAFPRCEVDLRECSRSCLTSMAQGI